MKNQAHPIVIVKRRKHKGHGGGSHGSWKIAYADFMTAMMAFFLVMWLISISSPKELIQIAEYFRTPLATAVRAAPGSRTVTVRSLAAVMISPSRKGKCSVSRTWKICANVWNRTA